MTGGHLSLASKREQRKISREQSRIELYLVLLPNATQILPFSLLSLKPFNADVMKYEGSPERAGAQHLPPQRPTDQGLAWWEQEKVYSLPSSRGRHSYRLQYERCPGFVPRSLQAGIPPKEHTAQGRDAEGSPS